MNECNAIHETAIGQILDLIDTVKDLAIDDLKKLPKLSNSPMATSSSIANASSNLTMVFPVVCSRNISIENASMVSKAIERNCVSMLQRLFASYQITSDGIDNIKDYIAQFHQNLDSRLLSGDDIGNILRRLDEMTSIVESCTPMEVNAVKNDMNNINFVLPSNINESSLNDYVYTEDAYGRGGLAELVKGSREKINSAAGSKYDKDANKNAADFLSKQVLDSDYKKANELMPTTMVVNVKTSEGTEIKGGLVAVKAKLYPISSDDIITNVSRKIDDKNWLIGLIRASTREISFVKDFALAIDRAKVDALAQSTRKKSSDKMWRVLERRAINSRLKKAMRSSNAGTASITTLCVSQEEVEFLRKNNNIDMERISTINHLFESLNLMCVCIVDESLEVAKFIYDTGDPMWETISFTHLERESNDNTYKRVVNLMTKVSR